MQAGRANRPAANDDDLLAAGVDKIITEHGGNARAAVRSLLEVVSYLEKARDRAWVLMSYGYVRGKVE